MNQEIELKLKGFPELFIGEMPSKSKPIIVENPSLDGTEEVKITDIYCDLIAGKEYEFSAEASLPFAKSLDDGVEYYLFKDKSSSVRIGITHLGRVDRTDSIPEMYFDRIVDGNKVTARFTPQVSGRYYLRCDNNQDNSVAEFYNVSIKEHYVILVTDSAERSAQVGGNNQLKLSWYDAKCVNFSALSFVDYNNQRFFLKTAYKPKKEANTLFKYDAIFYKIENIIANAIFFRYVDVDGTIWQEPEFSLNANKRTITEVIVEALNQLPIIKNLGMTFATPFAYEGDAVYNDYNNTKLTAFSFSGTKYSEVLSQVAEAYETEWWIEDTNDSNVKVLHFDLCEIEGNPYEFSDDYSEDGTYSGGLSSIEISNTNEVPERIYVYGSERNITRKTVQQQVAGGVMNLSYAKRLRLSQNLNNTNHITDSGIAITVNSDSSITINGISNGFQEVYTNDEIYPKMDMVVSEVRVEKRSDDTQYFYIKSPNLTADFMDSEIAESYPDSINPSRQGLLLEGMTLMVTFTSGLLNGMEFECAWYGSRVEIGIVPNEEDDQQLPYGNFAPQVGDSFILWNLAMPQSRIAIAQEELFEDAKKYIDEITETINDCKCKSDSVYFAEYGANIPIELGQKVKLTSEVFANQLFAKATLSSRIVQYSYKLTKPYDISFNLSKARRSGLLETFENELTDIKGQHKQVEQLTRSISRRQWHDIEEIKGMVDTLQTQMLVVGNEHDNFVIDSQITYKDNLRQLKITNGELKHGSYVEYGDNGAWKINGVEINLNNYDTSKPYYLYVYCPKNSNVATNIKLEETVVEDSDNTLAFMVGILSSEYEGSRVFNLTSGLTTVGGGTITTEQIQDYNRNLIIDFSSNPPRIIARNGAIIEGNIKFSTLKDKNGNDITQDIENIKPITQALESTTEIEGGLVNTSVLMVRNNKNAISGGISGQSTDNIAFWSGGTLNDAINGNCNVIIRKDGTAKIGAFLIEKGIAKIQLENGSYATMSASGIEVALANGGTATYSTSGVIVKDEDNKEKIKLVDDVIDFSKFRKENVDNYNTIDTITTSSVQRVEKNITSGGNIISFRVPTPRNYTIFKMPLTALNFRKLYSSNSRGRSEEFNLEIFYKASGEEYLLRKYAIRLDTVQTGNNYDYFISYKIATNEDLTDVNWDDYEYKTIPTTDYILIEAVTLEIEGKLLVDTYEILCRLIPGSSSYASGTTSIQFQGSASYKIEEYEPKTIIGTNGIMNFQTSYKYFGAYLDNEDKYHIEAKGNINLNGKVY